jgi:16S rRNA (uracil1498-N3)-methyltransferase
MALRHAVPPHRAITPVNARFHAPDAHQTGELVALPSEEAQHLTRVLRLGPGSAVRVFDGRGHEFDAVVEASGKAGVMVRLQESRTPAPEPQIAITLVQAVLKGDKMDDVVRDAVMMGVSTIQPVVTSRTEVALTALHRGSRLTRWQRVAVSSAKQCGRAVVPTVRPPVLLDEVFTAIERLSMAAHAIMLVEPGGSPDAMSLAELADDPRREATVIIGPEGGWTADEIEHGSSRCRLVTVGGRTFRADAMPIIALSVLFTIWKEY